MHYKELAAKIEAVKKACLNDIREAKGNAVALERLRFDYLGRKGSFTNLLKEVQHVSEAERPLIGTTANAVKNELMKSFDDALVQEQKKGKRLGENHMSFDPTLPGIQEPLGSLHPLSILQYRLEDICRQMGFVVLDGPEVESEYYNFTALNIPSDHPARDMQDTFWLSDGNLLRTHTSPVQVRALKKYGAPFRGVVPGRVFRYESTDASHDHTFYQMEGLMVDEGISISNLIATMKILLQSIFETSVDVRLRPGYFPFVEPGFELDIKCLICKGKGCSVCKKTGWLELMPCGLIHPNVLEAGNVDSKKFSGFAFGLGLTRLVMMKYGIDDIRHLFSGDIRFSSQF